MHEWLINFYFVFLITVWWGAGVVICLEQGADLHMAQLMPLPLTVSCFSKIQSGFTFLVPAHLGSPGQRAVKRMCVCVCSDYRLHQSFSGSSCLCSEGLAKGLYHIQLDFVLMMYVHVKQYPFAMYIEKSLYLPVIVCRWLIIGTAHRVCEQGLCNVMVSVCLPVPALVNSSKPAAAGSRLLLWARQAGVKRLLHSRCWGSGGQCGQCHIVSVRRKLNRLLLIVLCSFIVFVIEVYRAVWQNCVQCFRARKLK